MGKLFIIVGATGIIVNWQQINGRVAKLIEVGVNWATDTASDVTDRLINGVARTGAIGRGILGRVRGAIENVVRGILQFKKEDSDPDDPERDGSQDRKLSDGEVDRLIEAGEHPHDLKEGCPGGVSKCDLYKDRQGNIYVKPKGSSGAGEFTGLNINDF